MKNGDFLFYCDSGAHFIKSIDPLIDISNSSGQDIIPFDLVFIEKAWTKRDAFVLLDCDTPRYTDTRQRQGGFILLRKSELSEHFVHQWLEYAQDERILTDIPNQMGLPNYPEFKEHRHDQSTYSLLTKKFQLVGHRNPSQWGENVKELFPNDTYPTLINNTRAELSFTSYLRALLWLYLTRFKSRSVP